MFVRKIGCPNPTGDHAPSRTGLSPAQADNDAAGVGYIAERIECASIATGD